MSNFVKTLCQGNVLQFCVIHTQIVMKLFPRKPMYTEHITIHQQFLTVHYWLLLGKDQLTRDQRVGIKFVANFAS